MFKRLLPVFLLAWTLTASAEENLDYHIRQDYISIRALGAGNSFTVIDDYNTLFYNPAGLAQIEEAELNFGFMGGITSEAMTFAKDIDNAAKEPDENTKIDKLTEVLQSNYGKNHGTRVGALNAIWVRPRWGVGIVLADTAINLGIHQIADPRLNITAYSDSTLAFGMARRYLEDALTVGGTIKAVYRGYIGKSVGALDLATNSNFFRTQDAQEGLTVDADLGTQYRIKFPEHTFLKYLEVAAVVRNLADYGFTQNFHLLDKDSGSEPPKLGRRFDVGTKMMLPLFWVFTPKFMFDVRDMGHRHWTFMKGLHTGFELDWKAFGWLLGHYSVGLGQGYLSAGVGAQLTWFRLDAATYGEEIGTSQARKENRFFIAKLSLDF